jgi:GAF domain-containing protein
MKRRSRASSKLGKTRRRKAARPKRRKAASVSQRRSSTAGEQTEVARLRRELSEAQEQQKATAEVLQVISRSTFDLESLLKSLVQQAVRLCGAERGLIYRQDGDVYRVAASYGHSDEFLEKVVKRNPIRQDRSSATGRAVLERRVVHIHDILADPEYRWATQHRADEGMHRTILAVPMLKEDAIIGVIAIRRPQVLPFTDKQIALVQNFADQAVIAIENVRLFEVEQRQRRELQESLEYQTAISDVLEVISRSPSNVQPVLDTITKTAQRLCGSEQAYILRLAETGRYHVAAAIDAHPGQVEWLKQNPLAPNRGSVTGRVALEGRTIQVADVLSDPEYTLTAIGHKGYRTILGVPLLREGVVIGVVVLTRSWVQAFTEKQVDLITTFATQAVIAIENTRLLNELRESLEQQTATSEVLGVISKSPGALEPVFNTMLENATRICEAKLGNLFLLEGTCFRAVAVHGESYYADWYRREPVADIRQNPGTPLDRLTKSKQVIHIPDLRLDQSYLDGNPRVEALADTANARTELVVPMLKEDELIGAIIIYRQEVRPFTDKQIALVQNFAAQAVIAIENTRLLNELRESLEQQTATSEVLKVISSSPGELQPVFDTMLAKAVALCEASFGAMWLVDGEGYRTAALHGDLPQAYVDQWRGGTLHHPKAAVPMVRANRSRKPVHVPDMLKDKAYLEGDPLGVSVVEIAGIRTLVTVPMLKEDEAIGNITIYRKEVCPFTDKQIALVQNFASQAVIAIENARLLNELRESLEQQTATSEVLKVISTSPGELEPVFDAMVENAVRLCQAEFGNLFLYDGQEFVSAALHSASTVYAAARRRGAVVRHAHPDVPLNRLTRTKKIIHIADVRMEQSYIERDPTFSELVDVAGARTLLVVPMLKENELVGALAIYRREVRPFTDKQIALVQNFAAQAVIAIENTRLLNELRESLQQQTATADVLKVISRSTFDLQAVLDTLTESAARLCEADVASMHRQQGKNYQAIATYGTSPEHKDLILSRIPFEAGRGSVLGRTVLERKPIQITDVLADPDYSRQDVQKLVGFRTVLGVPLLREGNPIGAVMLMRLTVRPFTDRQIELAQTFADQAGIAIENVRLFDEIQDKSRQLEEASKHKSQFLANMSHELRTPLNAILGYTELMADGAYGEPSEKMAAVLKRLESNGRHLLGLINDVLDLSKIEAGQLALDLADYTVDDIAHTVRSTLEPLAADKKLAFKLELAPELPPGRGDGRRLTQVLINLVGNAIKFTDAGEVAIKAEANNGSFRVSVRDTGPGISVADQSKLFQEFQQADNSITRKKGGTGLGLAISKRIVEMHGGRIWIDSTIGRGSTFSFTVPVRVERQVETAEAT